MAGCKNKGGWRRGSASLSCPISEELRRIAEQWDIGGKVVACEHDGASDVKEAICDKSMLNQLDGIMNPTLRKRIDKLIVGKLIKAKV